MSAEIKIEDRGRKLNWLEACAILGCSRRQFYRLIERGVLPAYKLEGCRRGIWVYEYDVRSVQRSVSSA